MSYLRESERFSGLPTIGRSGVVETSVRRGITTIENDHYGHRESLFHNRPSSATLNGERKYTQELQDQIRMYRDDLARKEALISELTTVDTSRSPKASYDATLKIEEMYARDRVAESAHDKSEITALRIKVEGLQSQLRELQVQIDVREEKIREFKLLHETSRETESKHLAVVSSLRARLAEYEAKAGDIEGAAARSEVAIETLHRQSREQQDRMLSFESRIRALTEERERAELERVKSEQRYTEMLTRVSSILCIDVTDVNIDLVSARFSDLAQENAALRSKIASMKEYLSNAELETKASRETITRLVSDAEREQRVTTHVTMEIDKLRLERDTAMAREGELVRELELLKERLEGSQRAWGATRTELEEREGRFARTEVQLREFETTVRSLETTYRAFKEELAGILSESFNRVEPYEDQIRDRVRLLARGASDKSAHIELLEKKLSALSGQLDKQFDVHRAADSRLKQTEGDFYALQDRLKRAEAELASADMLRDGLRADKERYLRFLEDLSAVLKLESINHDMGMENITLSLMARVQQLVEKEGDLLVDRKTHIYNLQRKIKSLKEQLDSKELHMDLLRKKVASLEERLVGRSDVEREKEEEFVKNRKLLKLCDKYKVELNERRMEVQDLKARLLESSDIRNRTLQQERDLESLESKVGQLEHVRVRQAEKISGLKGELEETAGRLGEKRDMAHRTVHTLTAELKSLKLALQEVTNRERQLLDLRMVLARMLGLDVNTLAVPDFEIIARLEKLILANQSNVATVVALDSALEDVSDGFRAGYQNAQRTIATRARSPVRVTRSSLRTRTRSLSPSRKRDTRAY